MDGGEDWALVGKGGKGGEIRWDNWYVQWQAIYRTILGMSYRQLNDSCWIKRQLCPCKTIGGLRSQESRSCFEWGKERGAISG